MSKWRGYGCITNQACVCNVMHASLDQVPRGPNGTFHRPHSSTHATKKKKLQVSGSVGLRDVLDIALPRLSAIVGATGADGCGCWHLPPWPAPCISCSLP